MSKKLTLAEREALACEAALPPQELPTAMAACLRRLSQHEPFSTPTEKAKCQLMDGAKYRACIALWLLGCRYIPREYRKYVHQHHPKLIAFLPPIDAQEDSHPDPMLSADIYDDLVKLQVGGTLPETSTKSRVSQAGQRGQFSAPHVFDVLTPKAAMCVCTTTLPYTRQYHQQRNEFLLHNMRLVVHIAGKFSRSEDHIMDYVQEGSKGLLRAIDRFSYYKSLKFSTYATWWIKQQISRHITENNSTIRVPAHIQEVFRRLQRYVDECHLKTGVEPSKVAIAKHFNMPVAKVVNILYLHPSVGSLSEPVETGSETEMGDGLVDHTAVAPDHHATVSAMQNKLLEVLNTLPSREKNVLVKRFGIGDGQAQTLQEVGRIFGITRERVRQIEQKALKKLRHPQKLRSLRGDPQLSR